MFPPELVELIVGFGWLTLSTGSHRHAYSVTSWMLVSRQWLSIVVPIFLRDVWATSQSLMLRLFQNCENPGLAFRLAGINDVRQYLTENCRSLTVSLYQRRTDEYDRQCTALAEYVAGTSDEIMPLGWRRQRTPYYGIPLGKLRNVIFDWMPNLTSLHFVLVDCLPTYWYWHMDRDVPRSFFGEWYPDCLTDLHVTLAYTSPPPPLLVGAPRGTFFPPRHASDLRRFLNFTAVKRPVVRDANADFVTFLTTYCPSLECIESTAEFRAEDLPPEVADEVRDRLVVRRLAPTTEWGITGSDIPGGWPLICAAQKAALPQESQRGPFSSSEGGPSSCPERGTYSCAQGEPSSRLKGGIFCNFERGRSVSLHSKGEETISLAHQPLVNISNETRAYDWLKIGEFGQLSDFNQCHSQNGHFLGAIVNSNLGIRRST
ncbi:hypothetical protein FB45DRAFT_867407 [Roridomyces roridus]|uniref:Uncharacterized protein n=1 Tax=Roridomyces roridus TaxID=1738132 RepID=A0AAD7BQR2_9AGAR|nr:hypothetical protein FB45DRAFT_867407 [Roridomyces roridus]